MRSSRARSDLELAVEASSAHSDRELAVDVQLAVEVQQCPLGAGEEELANRSWRGGVGKEEDEEDKETRRRRRRRRRRRA